MQKKKVAITTLGCDKNRCDSEAIAGRLRADGFILVARDRDADIIIVNTCAFIESARKEAVRVIRAKLKYSAKVIVTGCITKYPELIPSGVEIWEIGAFHGEKLLSTPPSYVYIKIADGCDNFCSYCTIPYIRGRYKARSETDIISEVQRFAGLGVGEFILVAQDLTRYPNLVGLVRAISKVEAVRRIRLHYVYPDGITRELIQEIKTNPKVCKYIDVPFQHVSPRLLSLMNRRAIPEGILGLLDGLVVRSTFMVGFPTESEQDFAMLCKFLEGAQFDYVGFFAYSREKGTRAYEMKQVPLRIKRERLEAVERLQSLILEKKHSVLVGKVVKVVCDFVDPVLQYSVTRTEWQSPEVDPVVIVRSELCVGQYFDVRIVGSEGANLIGEVQ